MARWKRGGDHRATDGRRRAGLDYPDAFHSEASTQEARDAVATATLFVDTAAKLLPELGCYG